MIMRRCLRLLAAVVAAVCLGVTHRAVEPGVRNPEAHRSQARMAEIGEAIRAKLPKYQPNPARNEATMTTAEGEAEERDGVLNLPAVSVQARRPPEMTEYEMLTPKGRLDLALRRRPGLRIGNIFDLNNGIALTLLREDIEKEKRDALRDQVERVTFDDGAESRELQRVLKETLMHPNTDWMKGRSGRKDKP